MYAKTERTEKKNACYDFGVDIGNSYITETALYTILLSQ